ncbi:MAG: LacI family DNA-binding transcriptional regulator [Bacillota bacterium]
MANLKDVAKEAGVSVSTASLVLNKAKGSERISPECVEKVKKTAAKLGYIRNYHHSSIRTGRSQTIGFAIALIEKMRSKYPYYSPVNDRYLANIITGVEAAAHKEGYDLNLFGNTEEEENVLERGITSIKAGRFDGIVIAGSHLTPNMINFLGDTPALPMVVIEPCFPTSLPSVDFNFDGGIRLIVRHLAELGHRDLAWLGEMVDDGADNPRWSACREQVFIREAWDHGIKGFSYRIQAKHMVFQIDRYIKAVGEAVEAILAEKKHFTALVCFNDLIAAVACRTLLKHHIKIPGDIAVVGFDNLESVIANPPLTTIDHKLPLMGERAGELLLEMIKGGADKMKEKAGSVEIVEPALIVRESTAGEK